MDNNCSFNPECFFCHKNFVTNSNVNAFNLRQLFCYLKIKLKLDPNSVSLCSECNKLSYQLYQQIMELEVTQLKINYLLEQLVTKSCNNASSGADALQNLVKEKCISQLKTVKCPQVQLKRLALVRIVIPVPKYTMRSSLSPPSSPSSPQPEETIVKVEVESDPEDIQPTNTFEVKPNSNKKRPSDIPKACRFCPKILNNHRFCDYHEASLHPDKLLFEGKLDITSDSQFLEICQDVLTRHKVVNNQHGCLYCENCYSNMKCLKRHTVQSHLQNTIEKVRQLQQNLSKNISATGNELTCQYCNEVFKNINSVKNHKATACETLLQLVIIKSENVSKPKYPKFEIPVVTLRGQRMPCQFCPKTFRALDSLRLHSTVEHYQMYLNNAKFDNVSDENFQLYCQHLFENHYTRQKRFMRRSCVYCEKSFLFFRNYKAHLIDKHIDILYDKLKVLQKEPPRVKIYYDGKGTKVSKRACQNCGKWVKRQRLGTHSKYHCKKRKDTRKIQEN